MIFQLLVILLSLRLQQVVIQCWIKKKLFQENTFNLLLQCGDSPIVYKSLNMECVAFPKYVTNASCRIQARNWNHAVAQMDCDLIVTLRNISVRNHRVFLINRLKRLFSTQCKLEVLKKGYNNQYHPFLINVQFNFCDVISRKNFVAYGIMLWKLLKDYTNVNHSCPVKVTLILYLHQFYELRLIIKVFFRLRVT